MSENKNRAKQGNNMGLAIALGAGLGIVFGKFLFDDAGAGLILGIGIGVVFGSISNKKDKNNENEEE